MDGLDEVVGSWLRVNLVAQTDLDLPCLDAWGNLNSIAPTTNSSYTGCTEESGSSTTADGNNHLPIFSYDASGNTQNDGICGYTYDAESQIKAACGVTYLYDGSGRRVSKSNGKLYWYGSGGEILAETNAAGATLNEYIFFNGKRVAMLPSGGNAEYYAEDLLGSSRVVTTNTGTLCYDADFYPYGGERAYTNNCPSANAYKFEGKERDTETGNDDFGARYYSNRFGRWLSADWSGVPVAVPYANLTNPQTLNLYSMVADDPESFADLDGHCADPQGTTAATKACATPPPGPGSTGEGASKPNTGTGESSSAETPAQAQQQSAEAANQQAQEQAAQGAAGSAQQNTQPAPSSDPNAPRSLVPDPKNPVQHVDTPDVTGDVYRYTVVDGKGKVVSNGIPVTEVVVGTTGTGKPYSYTATQKTGELSNRETGPGQIVDFVGVNKPASNGSLTTTQSFYVTINGKQIGLTTTNRQQITVVKGVVSTSVTPISP